MEAAKEVSEHEGENNNASAECQNVAGPTHLEVPDPAQQHVPDRQVEQPPEDVHGRRGQPYSGRRRKGALECVAGDSVAKMG